ncbi:DUF2956 domain-containing protein [Vibrio zhugei]|uniref:DUF2956 domain-containing protein n=1 Tax=Vibrio zhugei TaxID=2479546 RepID=A0ABV7C8I0_9VIBR|nr:DUF2956 domain-containing protein [Vibrio zhugei]
MKNNSSSRPSPETQQEAMRMAKATQKPGQTKEQTKLIAQGIEHGIALYKKQQKEKKRQADKAKKKQIVTETSPMTPEINLDKDIPKSQIRWLPWMLLLVSWLGFITYLNLT